MTIRRRLIPYWLLAPGLIWLVLFFVIPMYYMGELSLKTGSLETGYQLTWAFENYTDSISEYSTQFIRAFWYAGVATFFCLLIGYPLAYAIAFKAGRWKNLMLFAVVAPFFTTYLIRTIAWKTILDDSSPVVSFLKTIHLVPQDGRVLATSAAVIAGLTYNFLPFMVLPIYASLERADHRIIEAGGDLYANGFTTFRTVTLPMSMPGVLAGTLLTFIPAAGDYVNAELLGSDNTKMVGNVIESQFFRVLGGFPTAAALSFTLMAIILALVFVYVRKFGTEELL
jgi:spermidine/putrescine transport system permease protein